MTDDVSGDATTTPSAATPDPEPGPTPPPSLSPSPSPSPSTDPAPPPATSPATPRRPALPVRLWRRFAALNTSNKFAAIGLLLAVIPLVTPVVTAGYDALFGDEAIAIDSVQEDGSCTNAYLIAPQHQELRDSVHRSDDRAIGRWERERKITHLSEVHSVVTVRGNDNKAVQLRELSIEVLSRGRPLPGQPAPPARCGGPGPPQIFVVDLDTLPLNRPVPSRYLLTSPQQSAAREEAKRQGRPNLNLPTSVTTSDVFDLLIIGRTQRHYTEWRATLTWWDGEKEHSTTIDNDGRPLRVTAAPR